MHRKLSKSAISFIILICICIIVVGIFFIRGKKDDSIKNDYILKEVVAENQVLKIELLDFVSTKNAMDEPTKQSVRVMKKESIIGVKITNEQTFFKTLVLHSPMEDASPFAYENKQPSHNAYILVLIGDVIAYEDSFGNEKNVIENARIDYYVQSVLLEESYNSLYILSSDGTKEKMVNVDDYKKAIANVDTYRDMLQW